MKAYNRELNIKPAKYVSAGVVREEEEGMRNTKAIILFLMGFLFNSVLLRLSGKIPDTDLAIPLVLLICYCAMFLSREFREA